MGDDFSSYRCGEHEQRLSGLVERIRKVEDRIETLEAQERAATAADKKVATRQTMLTALITAVATVIVQLIAILARHV